jgi:hypothetical protein
MASDARTSYVKCQVEPGMFRDEWLVYFDALDPKNHNRAARVQSFVDQREVTNLRGTPKRNGPAAAWLRVTLVGIRGDIASVILPQPATPFGETVLVSAAIVKEAPDA